MKGLHIMDESLCDECELIVKFAGISGEFSTVIEAKSPPVKGFGVVLARWIESRF